MLGRTSAGMRLSEFHSPRLDKLGHVLAAVSNQMPDPHIWQWIAPRRPPHRERTRLHAQELGCLDFVEELWDHNLRHINLHPFEKSSSKVA